MIKYRIQINPLPDGYHEGIVMLEGAIVETTEFAYLDPKDAKNEAKRIVQWIKHEPQN